MRKSCRNENKKCNEIKKKLQPAQNFQRFSAALHRIHEDENLAWVPLVLDAQAQGMDGERKLFREPALVIIAIAGIFVMVHTAGTGLAVFMVMGMSGRLRSSGMGRRGGMCCGSVLGTDNAERLALDFKERAAAGLTGLFEHFPPFQEVLCHNFIFFSRSHRSPSG